MVWVGRDLKNELIPPSHGDISDLLLKVKVTLNACSWGLQAIHVLSNDVYIYTTINKTFFLNFYLSCLVSTKMCVFWLFFGG